MINIYSSVIKHEPADWKEFFLRVNLIKVFEPIFDGFYNIEDAKKVIKFILHGYSLDSDMLHINGNTWSKISVEIFKKVELPDELYEDVALLKSLHVQECIQRYLEYQNDEHWTQYVTYRDLRKQMLAYSLAELKKSSGEIDIQAKMEAAQNSKELLKMMQDALETFVQNNSKLKSSVEAFNKAANREKNTRKVGDYAI